jgi:hypothetical protein
LNLRPPEPHSGALPNCATSRQRARLVMASTGLVNEPGGKDPAVRRSSPLPITLLQNPSSMKRHGLPEPVFAVATPWQASRVMTKMDAPSGALHPLPLTPDLAPRRKSLLMRAGLPWTKPFFRSVRAASRRCACSSAGPWTRGRPASGWTWGRAASFLR